MSHPHPCNHPPATVFMCFLCMSPYIRRDEGPLSRGYCSEDCERAAKEDNR